LQGPAPGRVFINVAGLSWLIGRRLFWQPRSLIDRCWQKATIFAEDLRSAPDKARGAIEPKEGKPRLWTLGTVYFPFQILCFSVARRNHHERSWKMIEHIFFMAISKNNQFPPPHTHTTLFIFLACFTSKRGKRYEKSNF
jgi:hypothetical protein